MCTYQKQECDCIYPMVGWPKTMRMCICCAPLVSFGRMTGCFRKSAFQTCSPWSSHLFDWSSSNKSKGISPSLQSWALAFASRFACLADVGYPRDLLRRPQRVRYPDLPALRPRPRHLQEVDSFDKARYSKEAKCNRALV